MLHDVALFVDNRSVHTVYTFEHLQRLRLADGVSPRLASFRKDVEVVYGKSWNGLMNCPAQTFYGPLFSMAIVQGRPKEFKNKNKLGKKFLQTFLVLQSDDLNNMLEIFHFGEVSCCAMLHC